MHDPRRLRVVDAAEVSPDTRTPYPAEALAGRLERQRRVHLLAATDAEDRTDHRRRSHNVGPLPVLGSLGPVDRRVLAGHLEGVHASLADVGVDPRHVLGQVVAELVGFALVAPWPHLDLALQVLLGVGRQLPHQPVEGPGRGRTPGERGELGPAQMAEDVHEEQPVLGTHVAHRPEGRRARVGIDVRHAVTTVAHDGHIRSRAVGALLVPRPNAKARVLEKAADAGLVESGRRVEQVAVERVLVVVVARARTGRLEGGQVQRADKAVGSGRQDVAKTARVGCAVGLRGGLRRPRPQAQEPRDRHGCRRSSQSHR